ncbi:hypothetical protein [Natronosalvus rutilus]|uniref:Uncharacterized protein n=1 Tax=Natronosalvus rutilus TaxID=2953753 RepID=A0A9E7NFD3_9EURY|nr:hypothetical protein [Natronosalvus rutilus]UTF55747.1 hypothetical protein NGM29_18830 [Natronosalvus rutilus]
MPRDIRIVDSMTQPDDATGTTVITGSHGGISSGRYAASLSVSGVVFNDAGIGRNEAGIRSLPYLDDLGCPAAVVDNDTARIADGVDMAKHGSISRVNDIAADLGCEEGQNALDCAVTMHDGDIEPVSADADTDLTEVELDGGDVPVWAVDSIGLIAGRHEGAITIAGSHGERLAGEFETYVPTEIAGITLFDAGVGKDDAGIGRLATMNDRGIPAAAVDVDSAHIGDAVSAWEDGVLSHVNDSAASLGVEPGDTPQDFAKAVREDRGA